MMAPSPANVAQGNAQVGIQAEAIHGDVYFELSPAAAPEEKFHLGVKFLDSRMPTEARALIEKAAALATEQRT